jgi:hypothetical protein
MESRGEGDTDISIVPWLDLVCIDLYSLLIALSPSIDMSIVLEPLHIFAIVAIARELSLIARIEYVDCESELVLTIPRWSTEGV